MHKLACLASALFVACGHSPQPTWTITVDPTQPAGALPATLLGHYDLSGALFHFDQVPGLRALMSDAGFSEWRVGLGRWEFGTQLLPTLTDGTSCAAELQGRPTIAFAPPGATDLELIKPRDWFTFTDGGAVSLQDTMDDSRYSLDYVRSVVDVTTALGAAPYLDIDHMPLALAANQTPERTDAGWADPCGNTWTNKVSNVRPTDPQVFAAAAAGMVQRLVEGSGGEAGRPVRYVEFWNEPELAYAWNPNVGDFNSYLQTAVTTLTALDTYRRQTTNADGQALRIGLGSFASADIAAKLLPALDANDVPFDFISFHDYDDDPLAIVAKIQEVSAARNGTKSHATAELALSEWGPSLSGSTLDPNAMDVALHAATVIALGAPLGLTHAHHSIIWQYWTDFGTLGLVRHDGTPTPAYYAYALLARVIGTGSSRLAPSGFANGQLDGNASVLASVDPSGKVRILIVNRGDAGTVTASATPSAVTVFADPTSAPQSVAPSRIITVPARSLVLLEM